MQFATAQNYVVTSVAKQGATYLTVAEKSLLFDLSGGEKRRVAIAGIIAMRPEVLVLDEPAAGLDPRGRESIFSNIVEYQRKSKSTVVIVSHSMEDMARFCDSLVVMAEGKVVLSGTPSEVFENSKLLSDIGLDIPQVTKLMLLLKKRGIEVNCRHYTVDSAYDELLNLLK